MHFRGDSSFRFPKHPFLRELGPYRESPIQLGELVPAVLRRHLLSPHWRDFLIIQALVEEFEEGRVSRQVLEQQISGLWRALGAELNGINQQRRRWLLPQQAPLVLHLMASACERLLGAVGRSLRTVRTGTLAQVREALEQVKEGVHAHEQVREQFIGKSEVEGWRSLAAAPGPFSSVLFVLSWGITLYVWGESSGRSLRALFRWAADLILSTGGTFDPTAPLHAPWKEAERETLSMLQLMEGAFFRPEVRSAMADPLEVRGILGLLAKAFSRLNFVLSQRFPEGSEGGKAPAAFRQQVRTLMHPLHGVRSVLSLRPGFFVRTRSTSAN